MERCTATHSAMDRFSMQMDNAQTGACRQKDSSTTDMMEETISEQGTAGLYALGSRGKP